VLSRLWAEYYSHRQGDYEKMGNFLLRKHALFRRLFYEEDPAQFVAHVVELTDQKYRSILRGYRTVNIEEFIEMANRV